MKFGRSTIATSNVRPLRGVEVAGGLPQSRQGGGGGALAYSPAPGRGGDVQVGAGTCDPPANLAQGGQAWCYDTGAASPIPLGAGLVAIPAAAGAVFGTNTYTLLPVEAVMVQEFVITDPSGMLLVSSIKVGRCDYLEAGPIAADALQSANQRCKLLYGVRLFPTTGAVITFLNPTGSPAPVIVTAFVWVIPCNGQAPIPANPNAPR